MSRYIAANAQQIVRSRRVQKGKKGSQWPEQNPSRNVWWRAVRRRCRTRATCSKSFYDISTVPAHSRISGGAYFLCQGERLGWFIQRYPHACINGLFMWFSLWSSVSSLGCYLFCAFAQSDLLPCIVWCLVEFTCAPQRSTRELLARISRLPACALTL
jgi:hypothetical protein